MPVCVENTMLKMFKDRMPFKETYCYRYTDLSQQSFLKYIISKNFNEKIKTCNVFIIVNKKAA